MADINDLELYLTDENGVKSLMNRIDFLDFVTEDDYTLFQINDKYQYRADMISQDLLGNKNLYFFIIWLNELDSLVDTVYDHILGQGDGCSRNFHFELLEYPVEIESSTLFYQVGNQTYYSFDINVDDLYGSYTDDKIDDGEIDYSHGLIDLFFNESWIPDLDSNIWIKFKTVSNNLKAGQIIKIPTYQVLYNYFNTVKAERGL
jgi:hypothetical protein